MSAIAHMTTVEKTTAIIMLAEALQAATLVGDPAPLVVRLQDWMHAPPRVGDLVVETSTKHRGPDPSRAGVVLRISRHRSAYARVTEILVLDPPCGKMRCRNQKCIHRRRWGNATFIRVPATAAQLAEALSCVASSNAAGVGRSALIATLTDAGIEVKPRMSVVRACLNCEQQVTLFYDEHRGYHRGICACGAHCTTGHGAP
jgi:hypothetical protein